MHNNCAFSQGVRYVLIIIILSVYVNFKDKQCMFCNIWQITPHIPLALLTSQSKLFLKFP